MTEGRGAWIIRRPKPRGTFGLRRCPDCGRLNGRLQRGDRDRCAIGVGCRKDGGQTFGRGR